MEEGKIMRKAIAVIAILVVAFAGLIAGLAVYAMSPHKLHMDSVVKWSNGADAAYEYFAYSSPFNCYIDSDEDLEDLLDDNEPEDDDGLGEQTLTVRFIGWRTYKTDNSGIWMEYPIPVYEFAG